MTGSYIREFKAKGIFRLATECSYAETNDVAIEILGAEKRGEIDVLSNILSDDSLKWSKDGQFRLEQFIELLLTNDLDWPPLKLIAACAKILNAPKFNREASLIPHYLGIYLERHRSKATILAETVLSDIQYDYFIPSVLPLAISEECDTWLPRLLSFIAHAISPIQKVCGFSALSNVESKFVEDCSVADCVFDFLAKFVSTPPYESSAIALYKACVTWNSNRKFGAQFSDLRDKLVKAKDKGIANVVALTERDEIASISEESLNARISAFSALLMNGADYVHTIDGYFNQVYKIYPEKLMPALEDILINGDGVVYQDGYLDETFKAISLGATGLKDKIITRWLASDKPELWRAVNRVVRSARREDDLGIRVCKEELPEDDAGKINVLRRAVGRMFESYVTCIGYAVSCLKYLSDESLSFVEPMFYTVLTLNFPDIIFKVKENLSQDKESDPRIVAFISAQIAQWNKLDAALKAVKEIRELLPPVKHRIAFARVESKKQREYHRELKKKSFLSLFPELPVLYGSGTIYKQYTAKGENRVAASFSKIESRVRIPSMLSFGEFVLQKELDDLKHLPVVKQ